MQLDIRAVSWERLNAIGYSGIAGACCGTFTTSLHSTERVAVVAMADWPHQAHTHGNRTLARRSTAAGRCSPNAALHSSSDHCRSLQLVRSLRERTVQEPGMLQHVVHGEAAVHIGADEAAQQVAAGPAALLLSAG